MTEDMKPVLLSDGCKIKVKILGDASDKPLLIAHHGAPGISTHKETQAVYSDFTDIFKVLVFDMRGCGLSDKKGPYTHKRWVQDVEELRLWAGVEKFVMAGASHGGFLTLEYALAHQNHLYGIIVGDSATNMRWGGLNAIKTALTDPRVKCDPDQVLRLFSGRLKDEADLFGGFGSIAPLYAAPDELKAQAEVNVDEVLAAAVMPFWETVNATQDALSRYDIRDTIDQIKIPTFVYVGRHDWITPVMLSEEMVEKVPHAKFVVYERSGHLAALEEKTKFQKDAREFVKMIDMPRMGS